jgi:hypothetical protein
VDEFGAPAPLFSGTTWYSVNANWDLDYTGPVGGDFIVVPSPTCDVAVLDDPESFWEGTWTGKRTVSCEDDVCTWVGHFKVVGKGHGGEIDGLQFRATEEFTTFTPLPVPWDVIPGFPYTGPEGIITGVAF